MISILRDYLVNYTALLPADVDKICATFVPKKFKADEDVIAVNSKVTLIGFIVEGILRAVEHKPSGERVIHYFLPEFHFFSEANGLFRNKPAKLAIEAATPATILCSTIEELYTMRHAIQGMEQTLNENKERELVDIIEAQEILHKGKSEDRYLAFLEQNPGLVNRLKDKDIASYLGISKYTLSHVKKRTIRKISKK